MTLTNKARAGFTLLELLVVIAIIGVLMGLTATAIFKLKAATQGTRTTETLTKLQQAYDQQYTAAITRIRAEQVPPGLRAMANNDEDMAKAVHMKLSLRREFPQNLADVNDTGASTGNAGWNARLLALYPPKKEYTDLAPLLATLSVDKQNAILLMAVLSQARGGASFNPEQIGSNASGTLPGTTQKIFVDGYGNPVYFVRALSTPLAGDAYTPLLLSELNAPPYVTAAAAAAGKADAIDPAGKFPWAFSQPATNPIKPFVDGMIKYMNEPLNGTNRGPFVFSGGVDNTPFTTDDLYSFRIQGTGKAN